MGSSGDEADKPKSTTPPISSQPPLVKSILEQTALGQECVEKEDLKGALQHFQSALEKTETLSDKEQPKLKLFCLLNVGACLVSSGEPERGLKLLETAWELIESQGTREGEDGGDERKEEQKPEEEEKEAKENGRMRADLLYHIGAAAQAMGDVEKAETNFKRSVDEHIKTGDKNQAADVFCALANCHQRASQHEKQIACLLSAQKLFGEAGEEGKEALTCAELSMSYLATGRDEECRQMLTTAKMMSLRLDDIKTQGHLHCRIGLIHSKLGTYDDAVQSFERALPLVRMSVAGGGGREALGMEASILQNIGAVHNERGNYSDAVIYNMAAAKLNGRAGEVEREAECFCNLAFAQTQLRNFTAAAEHYSCCLSKAQAAGSLLLQLQAHEGLGGVNYSAEQFSKAVSCFQQALKVLDEIRDDTGMARERVMEKLSDATQAFKRQSEPETASGGGGRGGGGGARLPVKKHVRVKKIQRLHSRGLSHDGEGGAEAPDGAQLANGGPRSHGLASSEATDTGRPTSSKGLQLDSSYDRQVQAYMDTYRHSADTSLASSSSSSTLASITSSSSGSSMSLLGASIFSRDKNHLPPPLPPSETWVSPRSSEVPEGSLALGLDTRQQFTTVEVEETDGGKGKRGKRKRKKGRRVTKIVPLNSGPPQEEESPTNTPPPPPPLGDASRAGQMSSNGRHSKTRSSLCVIL